MAKSASQLIFDQNKSTILHAIRDKGPVSRVELTRLTKISAPTVTRIVNSLMKEKLVKDTGMGTSSGGRPPVILEFDPDSCFVIGIEWGLTHIRGILANLDGEVLYERDSLNGLEKDIDTEMENVCDLVRYLLGSAMISPDQLKGIGIAAAGYINKRTGTIEYSPVQKWQNVNIRKPLQDLFQVPVFIDYLSRVMGLSEHLYGRASDIRDFLFITIDYGLGAGVLMDGIPVQGHDGFSGEIGHIRVTPPPGYEDRTCVCGKTNCLAAFASGRGLSRTARQMIAGSDSGEAVTAKTIGRAADEGDAACRKILSEAGEMLGVTIANMAHVLNPEAVILGGKLMRSGFFYDQIDRHFKENALRGAPREIKLLKSAMVEQSAVKGAAALVLQSILNFEESQDLLKA